MKRRFVLAATVALDLLALSPMTFAEKKIGRNTINASFDSRQTIAENDTPLNPDNVFGAEDGYFGSEVYTAGYSYVGDRFSFRLNDFGSFRADDNPDGRNCFGELYGSFRIGGAFLDLGKKRINQSLSYFKSPINFVLDDYDQYELRYSEGRIMASLDVFTDYGFLGLSYLPSIDFNTRLERYVSSSQDRQFLLRYDVNVWSSAVGFAVSRDSAWRFGVHASRSLGECAEFHFEGVFNEKKERNEISAGGSLAEESTVIVRNRIESLLGVTLNVTAASGIVEYYYNQAGYNRDEWHEITESYHGYVVSDRANPLYLYNLGLLYRTLIQNQNFNGRHYLMMRISNPSTDNYEVAMNSVINLQDGSVMMMPSLGYSGWNNISVKGSFAKMFGSTYSEFGLYGENWSCGLSVELFL